MKRMIGKPDCKQYLKNKVFALSVSSCQKGGDAYPESSQNGKTLSWISTVYAHAKNVTAYIEHSLREWVN